MIRLGKNKGPIYRVKEQGVFVTTICITLAINFKMSETFKRVDRNDEKIYSQMVKLLQKYNLPYQDLKKPNIYLYQLEEKSIMNIQKNYLK